MRLVLEVGYQILVFPAGAEVSAIVASLDRCVICDASGYGASKQYTPNTSAELSIKLLADTDPALPGVAKSDVLEKLLTTEKELNELRSKLYTAEAKLKAVGAAVDPPKAVATPL